MSKYLVVEFDSNEVAVISEKWLEKGTDGSMKALWPPIKSSARLTLAVKQHIEPDETWLSCGIIRVMYTTGKYFFPANVVVFSFLFLFSLKVHAHQVSHNSWGKKFYNRTHFSNSYLFTIHILKKFQTCFKKLNRKRGRQKKSQTFTRMLIR